MMNKFFVGAIAAATAIKLRILGFKFLRACRPRIGGDPFFTGYNANSWMVSRLRGNDRFP